MAARGNVKLLEDMFGKGGEGKDDDAPPRPTNPVAAPKIGNVKPKTTGPTPHDSTEKKAQDDSLSKELLELRLKMEAVKQALCLNENPVTVLNHLRQILDIPAQYYTSMDVEDDSHGQSSGNKMDIEQVQGRERGANTISLQAGLLMDDDDLELN